MSYKGIQSALAIMQYSDNLLKEKKQQAYDKQFGQHLKGFAEQGDAYVPEDGYDGRAYMAAKTQHMKNLLVQEDVKQKLFKNAAEATSKRLREGQATVKDAWTAAKDGNVDIGIAKLAASASAVPDGNTVSVRPDGDQFQIVLTDQDGNEQIKGTFATKQQVFENLFNRAKNTFFNPEEYQKSVMGLQQKIRNSNEQIMGNPQERTDKAGNHYMVMQGLKNIRTGNYKNDDITFHGTQIWDVKGKKNLTLKEAASKGLLEGLDTKQKQADIAKTKAETKKTKQQGDYFEAKGKAAGKAPTQAARVQYIEMLAKAKNITLAEAADLERQDKLTALQLETLNSTMKDYPGWADTQEGRDQFNSTLALIKSKIGIAQPKKKRTGIPDVLGSSHAATDIEAVKTRAKQRIAQLRKDNPNISIAELKKKIAEEFPELNRTVE